MSQAQTTMRRIGLNLVEERRAQVAAEQSAFLAKAKDGADCSSTDRAKRSLGRDILSVLIRSNIATEPSQRMSVAEILSQISTFIAAGHETTSVALTWCLYALSQSPLSQRKLRAAVRSLDVCSPALDEEIMRLPYLDWVVRESLRVHAPVTTTMRMCMREEDAIPVAEPFEDREGVMRSAIRVKKWDMVLVPIQAINKSRKLWGEDAPVFRFDLLCCTGFPAMLMGGLLSFDLLLFDRPERWESPPDAIKAIPGLYSNVLTFLNGNALVGNRACIGYKFALSEIKVFLYVLIRDIEFAIDPSMVIEKKVNLGTTRPFVKSEPHLGNQMPLMVRPVAAGPSSLTPPPSHTSTA